MCTLIAFVVDMERGFTRHAITTAVRLGMNQKYLLLRSLFWTPWRFRSDRHPCWPHARCRLPQPYLAMLGQSHLLKTIRYILFRYQTKLQVSDVFQRIFEKKKNIQIKKKVTSVRRLVQDGSESAQAYS